MDTVVIKLDPVAHEAELIVKVSNRTDKKVRCDLLYDAGPQWPHRTSTYVQPREEALSVFPATRKWFAVTVSVNCIATAE